MHKLRKPRYGSFMFLGLFMATGASAQTVHQYSQIPKHIGSADKTQSSPRLDKPQSLLVIPAVASETPFDPENNQLKEFDKDVEGDLIERFAKANDFWKRNSFGQVSFDIEVLPRYYQMPRTFDEYFLPSYVDPWLRGSQIRNFPVEIKGRVRLTLQTSDDDTRSIDLEFEAADSPYSEAALELTLRDQIERQAGERLDFDFKDDGKPCCRVQLTVPKDQTFEGSFIRVDVTGSDAAALDALGLYKPLVHADRKRITSRGAEFPLTIPSGSQFGFRLKNKAGDTQNFVWTLSSTTFNAPSDLVAAHGGDLADATISESGNELRFDLRPSISGPFDDLRIDSSPPELADLLGLEDVEETTGSVIYRKRGLSRIDRRLIAGEALASYLLNELTRSPSASGPGPLATLEISEDHEDEIDELLAEVIDPVRALALIFIDRTDHRAMADGGTLPIGIDHGDYRYEYATQAALQINARNTSAATIAHETGHNLALTDLYNRNPGTYDPDLRFPGTWDVMDKQKEFPHSGAFQKIFAGWIGENDMIAVPEPRNIFPNVKRVLLTPVEFSVAEYDELLDDNPFFPTVKAIRLPLGLGEVGDNHYLLIQNRATGREFSLNLPQAMGATDKGGLYITDNIPRQNGNFFEPRARNHVHPLTDEGTPNDQVLPIIDRHPDADIELSKSHPAYRGIEVDIIGEEPGPGSLANRPSYLVEVRRRQTDFLELGITPWETPPYESLDIWVEHGDSDELSDEPLQGNGMPARWAENYDRAKNDGKPLNWVRVRVTNSGKVDASEVVVRVQMNSPGGMGSSGEWRHLGDSKPQDIPGGESRIFDVPWDPKVNRHTCLRAEVFRWQSEVGDRNPWNNLTHENVFDFHPTSQSPWHETPFSFTVTNGHSKSIDVEIETQELPPGFTVTLDKSFLSIPAKQEVEVEGVLEIDPSVVLRPEALAELLRPFGEQVAESILQYYWPPPEVFHVAAFVIDEDYRLPFGGITYRVFPSEPLDLRVAASTDETCDLRIVGQTLPRVGGRELEVELRYPSGRYQWLTATTDFDGQIDLTVPPLEEGLVQVRLRFRPRLEGERYRPAESQIVFVETRERRRVDPTSVPAASGETGLFTLSRATTLARGTWSFGSYANRWQRRVERPAVVEPPQTSDWLYARDQLSASIAYGLEDRLEIALAFPYERLSGSQELGIGLIYGKPFRDIIDVEGQGNVRLGLKWSFFKGLTDELALGASLEFDTGGAPTGLSTGETGFGLGFSWSHSPWTFNLAYRDPGDPPGVALAEELIAGIGYSHHLTENFDAIVELVSTEPVGNGFAAQAESLDLTVGGRYWFGNNRSWAWSWAARGNLEEDGSVGGLVGLTYRPPMTLGCRN